MTEIGPSPEIPRERVELNTVLATYLLSAAMWASTEGFRDDVEVGISMINRGDSHWDDGKEITQSDKRAYVASSILVQLCQGFVNEIGTPVLSPYLASQLDMYLDVQAKLDGLGIVFTQSYVDSLIARDTVRAMRDEITAGDTYISRAAGQWKKRGELELEMMDLDDLGPALENMDLSVTPPDKYYEHDTGRGKIRVEEYPLPETPTWQEVVPYYKKFYDESQGEEWLTAILEDLKAIKEGEG